MMMLALGVVLGIGLGAVGAIVIGLIAEAADDNIPLTSWEQRYGRR